ncbi:MAG: M28 family peptidase [Planctomycetota bacterium]|nr:M28 family peptidase [Planctomycetota bacterium]
MLTPPPRRAARSASRLPRPAALLLALAAGATPLAARPAAPRAPLAPAARLAAAPATPSAAPAKSAARVHDPSEPKPLVASVPLPAPSGEAPPSRALLLELCREPRLAGTAGSERAAHWVAGKLMELGWRVELESRDVLLSYPASIDLSATIPNGNFDLFHRRDRFDPDRRPTGDVPLYHSWAKSGRMSGLVVDCGRGLRADFERLVAGGVDLQGAVALCRYGGAYRGVKVALAAEFGCHAALLYDHGDENGPGKGEVWPKGPWKPIHDAQRGSILSLTEAPGDPTTPGWASPLVTSGSIDRVPIFTETRVHPLGPGSISDSTGGTNEAPNREPLTGDALAARLPKIPSVPIGWAHAKLLLDQLERGPAPVVHLDLDMRVERRTIVNVIASFGPMGEDGDGDFVLAGTHRDAWVRGAQDSGSGIVSLLRTAAHLSERAAAGWQPKHGIKLAFWDAEETGLFGSTEYGEAHADELRQHLLAYVNGDACVSGLQVRASGTPGLQGTLERALARVPSPIPRQTEAGDEPSLRDDWYGAARTADPDAVPHLGLPGSGSDYTVFLHHLGLPVLDLGLGGNGGGQYHTAADDFGIVDKYLDPGFLGHETAGWMFAEVLAEVADTGRASFDAGEAARELGRVLGAVDPLDVEDLPSSRQEAVTSSYNRLLAALDRLAAAADAGELGERGVRLYQLLAIEGGLAGRPWYTNGLWAPGAETGYAAELLPYLRGSAPHTAGRIDWLTVLVSSVRDPEYAASVQAFTDLDDVIEQLDALEPAELPTD